MTDTDLSPFRVALDVDSTLAATSLTAFDLMGVTGYSYNDIDSWSWGIETFGKARYLNALWHAWSIRPHEIEPMEQGLAETTAQLSDLVDTVDVVTSHPDDLFGVDKGKQQWLDDHDIVYDEYVQVDGDKHTLDYDIFIDDKYATLEQLDDDQLGLLIDHEYNPDTGLPYGVELVDSVAEATRCVERLSSFPATP